MRLCRCSLNETTALSLHFTTLSQYISVCFVNTFVVMYQGINCMWVVQMCPEEDYSAVIEKTLVVGDNLMSKFLIETTYLCSTTLWFPYQPGFVICTFGLQELPWLNPLRHSVHRASWVWEIISNRQPLQSCERGRQISRQNSPFSEPPRWWLTWHDALDGDNREQSGHHCVSGHQGRPGGWGEGLRIK